MVLYGKIHLFTKYVLYTNRHVIELRRGDTVQINEIIMIVFDKTNEEIKKLKPVNIMLAGKTGVGKSTLINNIFRENIAKTGIGAPVTKHIKKLSKQGVPVNLYDTKGIELSHESQELALKEILDEINKMNASLDVEDHVHVIWYIINSLSNRIEPFEIEWINAFSERVPVVIVLSQCIHDNNSKELESYIDNLNLKIDGLIRILAEDYNFKGFTIKSFGLKELVSLTYDILPTEVKRSFNNAQKAYIEKKVEEAKKWALTYIGSTFMIGFTPIPFADAPIIAASQAGMIAHITSIFGVNINKSIITAAVSSLVGISGSTFTGKSIVANLFKLIPGAGTIIGGTIQGGTASIITTALAFAYINLMKVVAAAEYENRKISTEFMKSFMREDFRKNLKDLFKRKKKKIK